MCSRRSICSCWRLRGGIDARSNEADVFFRCLQALKYLKCPSEAKAIVNLLNIHRFKLEVKQLAETHVMFAEKIIKLLIDLEN